jgi:hypothetical protein
LFSFQLGHFFLEYDSVIVECLSIAFDRGAVFRKSDAFGAGGLSLSLERFALRLGCHPLSLGDRALAFGGGAVGPSSLSLRLNRFTLDIQRFWIWLSLLVSDDFKFD